MLSDAAKKQINGQIYAMSYVCGSTTTNGYYGRYDDTADNDSLAEYEEGIETATRSKGKHKWIRNGKNDTVPNIMRNLYRGSSIHNSAINVKANLIAGGGLEFAPLETIFIKDEVGFYQEIETNLSDAEKDAVVKMARLWDKNVGITRNLPTIAFQLALYGGFFPLHSYIMNREGNMALRRVHIEQYMNCRLGAERKFGNDGFQSTEIFIGNNFKNVGKFYESYNEFIAASTARKITKIPFDAGDITTNGRPGIYGTFHGRVTPFRDYYGTPDYESIDALRYMSIDNLLSEYDYNRVKNGFTLDYIVVIYRSKLANEKKESEQRDADRAMFEKNYMGPNVNDALITWVEPVPNPAGGLDQPKVMDIIPIPHDDSAKRFNILREERLIKILSAHNIVTGEIIGLPRMSGTGFSSQSEFLIHAQTQLFWNVVRPYQLIQENYINDLLMQAGLPVKATTKKSLANFRILTEQMMQWAFGVDEARQILGHGPMADDVAREVFARIGTMQNIENDPTNPDVAANAMSAADIQTMLNAYGLGVRSGAITPIQADEQFFRDTIGLPTLDENADKSWDEDEGFRRPVTLKSRAIQKQEEQGLDNQNNNQNGG